MENDPYEVIRSNYPGYSRTFRRIADYILENGDRFDDSILKMTIRDLAARTRVAESSIIRFCRECGFSGFSEFKIMLAKYSRRRSSIIFESLADDAEEKNYRDIFSLTVETLQIARDQMDYSTLEKLTDAICSAGRIICCGVGMSGSVAVSFAAHLQRVGIPAQAVTDGELLQMAARTADPDALFIGISKSGRSAPIVYAFETAHERGAVTACLSGYRNTPLGRHCDIQVIHYCPTTMLMNCRVVQNTIIDCVYLNAARRRQQEAEQAYRENRQAISRLYVQDTSQKG